MSEEKVKALFLLAGISIIHIDKLPNQYWPDTDEYDVLKAKSPWWKVWTDHGPFVVGWRKRVISIDWSGTGLVKIVTPDDVTKNGFMVHAYSYGKAVEYLQSLISAKPGYTYTTVPIRKELYPTRKEMEAKQAQLDKKGSSSDN